MSTTMMDIMRVGEVLSITFEDATLIVVGNEARWTPAQPKLMDITRLGDTEQHLVNTATGETFTIPYKTGE